MEILKDKSRKNYLKVKFLLVFKLHLHWSKLHSYHLYLFLVNHFFVGFLFLHRLKTLFQEFHLLCLLLISLGKELFREGGFVCSWRIPLVCVSAYWLDVRVWDFRWRGFGFGALRSSFCSQQLFIDSKTILFHVACYSDPYHKHLLQ